jgi:uncharacterized membrane protein
METFILLLLIAILILVVNLRNSFRSRMDEMQKELLHLGDQLKRQPPPVIEQAMPAEIKTEPPVPVPGVPPVIIPKTSPPEPKPVIPADGWQSGFRRIEEPVADPGPKPITGAGHKEAKENLVAANHANDPSPSLSFSERHPDLEKFIGENLVSKIGIVTLVIAIGFFVKYAIDQDWIGPAGRVGIGILCGAILVGLAHRLRNIYRAFSSVLTGGGLAVFYFTITLAFQQFHLFGQATAFMIMVVITGFSVALSLLYNKQEVAVLALIGGFATPFMASNGGNNYQALFTYLLVLNAGLLVISYYKKWRLLNMLAFLFTVILFASWLAVLKEDIALVTYIHALWFATAFYLVFFAINVAHNIRQNKQFIASDFGILLANTALYFAAAIYCLSKAGLDQYNGLLCILLALFNLGISYTFFKNKKVDTNILYLLIGITLTFISLAAPMQLKGNQITLFWACETVLLYWLYQKSKIEIMRVSSMVVWACMLLSLFMDWNTIYFSNGNQTVTTHMPVLLNKGFIVSLFAALSTALLHWMRNKDADAGSPGPGQMLPSSFVFGMLAVLLLFASGSLEINYHFDSMDLKKLYQPLYTYAFIILLLAFLKRLYPHNKKDWIEPALLVICIFIYLVNASFVFDIQRRLLEGQRQDSFHFAAHWISAGLVAFILFRVIQYVRHTVRNFESNFPGIVWITCLVVIIFLSIELHLLINLLLVNDATRWEPVHIQFIKIGLPILWSVCSFAFMWLGMHYKHRTLRIISLVLLAITLLKLFLFDIRHISEGGKIAAFFCLGVILLIVSFMYQRLKKIIISQEKPGMDT